jgi:hypothetical protein
VESDLEPDDPLPLDSLGIGLPTFQSTVETVQVQLLTSNGSIEDVCCDNNPPALAQSMNTNVPLVVTPSKIIPLPKSQPRQRKRKGQSSTILTSSPHQKQKKEEEEKKKEELIKLRKVTRVV